MGGSLDFVTAVSGSVKFKLQIGQKLRDGALESRPVFMSFVSTPS